MGGAGKEKANIFANDEINQGIIHFFYNFF
jgi:hypothetical protein